MTASDPKAVASRILSLRKPGEQWKHFAKRLGMTPQSVSNYRSGAHGASLDAAAAVLRMEPNLSGQWLLAGVEPQWRPPPGEAEKILARVRAALDGEQAAADQADYFLMYFLSARVQIPAVREKAETLVDVAPELRQLHAGIALVQQNRMRRVPPSEEQLRAWDSVLELLESAGVYDPAVDVAWSEEEIASIAPKGPEPVEAAKQRAADRGKARDTA